MNLTLQQFTRYQCFAATIICPNAELAERYLMIRSRPMK